MSRRVLVPTDGSLHADATLKSARDALADAETTVPFVLGPFDPDEEPRRPRAPVPLTGARAS